jgi:antitoxin component of MazEF toxin-antitoxin module
MSSYKVTVFKAGNSYALRVPKEYIEKANLHLGDKADIPLPTRHKKQDRTKIEKLFRQLQEVSNNGSGLANIKDPVAWQREIREDRSLPGRD